MLEGVWQWLCFKIGTASGCPQYQYLYLEPLPFTIFFYNVLLWFFFSFSFSLTPWLKLDTPVALFKVCITANETSGHICNWENCCLNTITSSRVGHWFAPNKALWVSGLKCEREKQRIVCMVALGKFMMCFIH